jgi:hypothetical protein
MLKMDIHLDDIRYTVTNTDMLRNYINSTGGTRVEYGIDEMQIVLAHLYNPKEEKDRYYIFGPSSNGEYALHSHSYSWNDVVDKIRKMKYKQWKENVHVDSYTLLIEELLRRRFNK